MNKITLPLLTNDKGYSFIRLVSGAHDRAKHNVWVNRSIIDDGDKNLQFPIVNAVVTATDKGNYVIRPLNGSVVYYMEIDSGYRGSADIYDVAGGTIIIKGYDYASPTGSLGCTAWALINATIDNPIIVTGMHDGRRIDRDNENITLRLYPDGGVDNPNEDELDNLLN